MSQGPEGRRLSFKMFGAVGKGISLPCGRCVGCRLERSRQWAVRLMHESEMHEASSFLTLTYSDEHLPSDGSLSVETCQLFMKRLRERLAPIKIRFFLCGEYGEKFGRPHYHAIIFGYGFPDKIPLERQGEHQLFISDLLLDVWGLGHVSIGSVTFDSTAYVARYSMKKVSGDLAEAHYQGRKPEFLLMSRRPGIGRLWIDKHLGSVYPSDEVIVNAHPSRPPRYYDQVLEMDNPGLFDSLKIFRSERAENLDRKVVRSGLPSESHPRRLAVRRRVAEAKLKLKSRNVE